MKRDNPSKEQARKIFSQAFINGSVFYTTHCRERMAERGVDVNDLIGLSKGGLVYNEPEIDIKTGEKKYTIEHPSPPLKAVFIIASEKKIRLLTVITGRKK
jgi:hypothetical protein